MKKMIQLTTIAAGARLTAGLPDTRPDLTLIKVKKMPVVSIIKTKEDHLETLVAVIMLMAPTLNKVYIEDVFIHCKLFCTVQEVSH